MAAELVNAYILHSRPYQDSSLIADLFTIEYGRIGAVFKGARSLTKKRQTPLQLFQRGSISVSGKQALKTGYLKDVQKVFSPKPGPALYSGLYVNELLCRVLTNEEPSVDLFAIYEWVLDKLVVGENIADALRVFEFTLLQHFGYGVDFSQDADGNLICDSMAYYYCAGVGFLISAQNVDNKVCFQGDVLLSIHQNEWNKRSRLAAKHINRLALAPLLGSKPLSSRALFSKQT